MVIETRGIILSKQRTSKVLIRLHGCAGIKQVSHDVAHTMRTNCASTIKNSSGIIPVGQIMWVFGDNSGIILLKYFSIKTHYVGTH